ncbi:MAG: stage V sporulation protein S [Mesoaciditoga sp.]|uniref:stage V sporulation protein S n=1 Tax=Athalassotoga TaxID=1769718 RepID=UPI000CAA7629|nr:stage V sporulation protein S [Athalassotoga saccharophila]PMP70278.1 MAG: stage V sporulation protein S [Mesoaciditoga sp.]PMP79574.1 MAG: stage V sporulation protein S [Mesoaciditoga sp.]BBJ27470.1 stage V sporulation protein S [Athalassotoga saccharophila]HEU24663.1 stage V sporulation protein S [Mesoaciditoga lauensis]
METLKVSSKSNPNSVAGAIAGALGKDSTVEIQAIGAGAVNQAVKAIAVARRFINENGKDIGMIPGFVEIEIGGEKRTGVSMKVFITGPFQKEKGDQKANPNA